MMPIERMRPEDFDAVFRLLSQSFPAGERRDAAGQRALLFGQRLSDRHSARAVRRRAGADGVVGL